MSLLWDLVLYTSDEAILDIEVLNFSLIYSRVSVVVSDRVGEGTFKYPKLCLVFNSITVVFKAWSNFYFMDSHQDLLRNLLLGSKRLRHPLFFCVNYDLSVFSNIKVK